MNYQISEVDHKILIFLGEGKKVRDIEIEGIKPKTIYGRIRNLRLQFGVKTNKELIETYKKMNETEKSA